MQRMGGFLTAMAVLAVVAAAFFVRQNAGAQIGGPISVPKILWLTYAIAAWFVLPAFLLRWPLLTPQLKRLFLAHLINFSIRAVIEVYLLYVTVSWSPLYGIAHDVFSILLISVLARVTPQTRIEHVALHFAWSLRVTLICEIVFAAMFYQLTSEEHAIYFASHEARFATINVFTAIVVAGAYADLAWVIARLRLAQVSALEERSAHA